MLLLFHAKHDKQDKMDKCVRLVTQADGEFFEGSH